MGNIVEILTIIYEPFHEITCFIHQSFVGKGRVGLLEILGQCGSREGSLKPPWRPNYFIFMGILLKILVKLTKRTPLRKFDPPPFPEILDPAQAGQ